MKILPVYYFPSVAWFSAALHEKSFVLEQWEHYRKQNLYNRTRILAANGVLKLSVPMRKSAEHTPLCDKKIAFDWKWQREQWMSVTSAYRSSPYFEFYEDILKGLFFLETDSLLEYNLVIVRTLSETMQLDLSWQLSEKYDASEAYSGDYRRDFDPRKASVNDWFEAVPYPQVFGEGFAADLSILDLLCNQGPASSSILRESYRPSH